MAISAHLQPFTGYGDFSIWVKNSRMGRKALNKQTNERINIKMGLRYFNYFITEKDLSYRFLNKIAK